ncbi:hypothetical protein [Flagellimonas lutaonensis]|uniref:Cupin family protein n=1 Tax=Flagellimonas lutaonensis TaxID=516051 RepID=A0A0D5YVG1_9FLAO|nr:hypothetical protein [Allomuricauda lutaonensis]AKA35879.1 Cupin family protein [Allomuricauda lutaonensis]
MRKLELNPAGNFKNWSSNTIKELEHLKFSEIMGNRLMFENDSVTLWEIVLKPKERIAFRRHKYPFVVYCINGGILITRYASGKVDLLVFEEEDSYYQELQHGFLIQDLENVGHDTVEIQLLQLKYYDEEFINMTNPKTWLNAV